MPEIIALIFNQQGGGGGGGNQRFCYVTEGGDILLTFTDRYKGGGRGKFSPKTALRNV